MNDTRMIHILAAVDDARTGIGDMLDEPCKPHDFVDLGQAEALLSAARKLLQQAQTELAAVAKPMVCNAGYGFSSYCTQPLGHPGDHSNGNITWDDAKAEATRQSILRTMGGRTE